MQTEYANIDDLMLKIGEDGLPLPVEVHSPYLGKTVSIRPFTYGYYRNHCTELENSATEWPDEVKLDLLKRFVVTPDLSSLTVERMRDEMDRVTVDHLIVLIVQVSIPLSRARVDNPRADLLGILESLGHSAQSTSSSTGSDTDTQGKEGLTNSIFTRFTSWFRPKRKR